MAESKTNKQQEKTNLLLSDELESRRESLKLLRDKYNLSEDLVGLLRDEMNLEKSQRESIGDVVDKTKEVLENRKAIYDSSFQAVDLEKLHRQLIAEGLDDRAQIITKLKAEQEIQKQTNRIINTQAGIYESIGGKIDSLVRSIPGVGGILGDLLGTNELGTKMSESFRTSMAQSQSDAGGFGQQAAGEFVGSFASNIFRRKGRERDLLLNAFTSLTTVGLVAAGTFVAIGLKDGIESLRLQDRLKKFIAGSSFEGLRETFGNIDKATVRNIFNLRRIRFQFGVQAADAAKILQAQTEISGLTDKQAGSIQRQIARFATLRGVVPTDAFQDIANNTELFAQFSRDGGLNIGQAAVQAKELGLSLNTVSNIAESVLDFQSSIESELKASLLIGRQLNLNRARELALSGDLAGLQQEIVSLVGSEQELNRLNVIQRKALAQALGITVAELGRLASGEVELQSSDLTKNTEAIRFLTQALLASVVGRAGTTLARAAGLGVAGTAGGRLGGVARSAENILGVRAGMAVGRGAALLGGGLAVAGGVGLLLAAVTTIISLIKKNNDTNEGIRRNTNNGGGMSPLFSTAKFS
jgi:hypothetical protein